MENTRFNSATKLLAVLLAILMALSLFPVIAIAEDEKPADVPAADADKTNQGLAFEVTDRREETVKHFRLSDGTYAAVQYDVPVHTLDDDGVWQDIDNTLTDVGSAFATSNARVKFAKKIPGNESLFTLHDGNAKVTVSLNGATKKTTGVVTNTHTELDENAAELQKLMQLDKLSSRILYAEIMDGVDIEYVVESLNIKENIIVKERLSDYSFSFTLALNNLTAELTDAGEVCLLDPDRSVAYVIPAGYMTDADGVLSDAVTYTLTDGGNGKYTLTITADADWINDSVRAFPVTIDPPIYVGDSNEATGRTYTNYSSLGDSGSLYCGYAGNYMYVPIWKISNLPTIDDSHYISDAYFEMYCSGYTGTGIDIGIYEANTTTWASATNWNDTNISRDNKLLDYAYVSTNSRQQVIRWNVLTAVKSVISTSHPVTFLLRPLDFISTSDSLPHANAYASFSSPGANSHRPVLVVEYKDNKGTESYFAMKGAGTSAAGAGFVNMATGNLVYTIPTLSTADSLFSATVSLIYNSCAAHAEDKDIYVHPYTGYGFRLNVNEALIQIEYRNASGNAETAYRWVDGDGTTHWFLKDGQYGTAYKDEDGLGLILTDCGTYFRMESQTHIVRYFSKVSEGSYFNSNGGILTAIEDQNGNRLEYSVNEKGWVVGIDVVPVGLSAIHYLDLTYQDNKLARVEDAVSGRSVVMEYSAPNGAIQISGSWLRKITYCHRENGQTVIDAEMLYSYYNFCVNGIYTTFRLSEATDELHQYSIRYEYDEHGRVDKVEEYGGTGSEQNPGQYFEITYGTLHTEITNPANTVGGHETAERYVFDKCGRAVGSYVYDTVDCTTISSSSVQYSDTAVNRIQSQNSGTDSYSNQTNLLAYGDFDGASIGLMQSQWTQSVGQQDGQTLLSLTTVGNNLAWKDTSVKITGSVHNQQRYRQEILNNSFLSGQHIFILSVMGKGTRQVANSNSRFGIEIVLTYTNGSTQVEFGEFDPFCTEWQHLNLTITSRVPDGASLNSVAVSLVYDREPGNAYFDNVCLYDVTSDLVTYYQYTDEGKIKIAYDAESAVYYQYNENGDLEFEASDDGTIIQYFYDSCHRPVKKILFRQLSEDNGENILHIDFLNNDYSGISQSTLDDAVPYNRVRYTYNTFGLVTQTITEEVERYTETNMEDGLRIISKMRSYFAYNTQAGAYLFGAVTSQTGTDGRSQTYIYDNTLGYVQYSFSSDVDVGMYFTYDEKGNLIGVYPLARTTYPLAFYPESNAESAEYTYDEKNMLVAVSTATCNYSFSYDKYGNRTEVKRDNEVIRSYSYAENNSALVSMSDGEGNLTEYIYDVLDRLSRIDYNGVSILGYRYNTNGSLSAVSDYRAETVTSYSYNDRGIITSVAVTDLNDSGTRYISSSNQYDSKNRVIAQTLIYSIGAAMGQLDFTYQYDARDILSGWSAGPVSITYCTDNLLRINSKTVSGGNGFSDVVTITYKTNGSYTTAIPAQYTSDVDGVTTRYSYQYDANGNITRITDESGRVTRYQYDNLGQLTREDNPYLNKTYVYAYDNGGNRTSKTEYNYSVTASLGAVIRTQELSYSGDRLVKYTTDFDGNGNPTAHNGYGLEWDGSLLTKMLVNGGQFTYTFTYNADGIRTSKNITGTLHTYLLSGTQIVTETIGNRTLLYLYDEAGLPVGLGYRTTADLAGTFTYYFFEKNLQGDIIAVYTENGTKVGSYVYDAWGNCSYTYATGASPIQKQIVSTYNPFRYRGYYLDVETGLYYLQTRYYDPAVGRFLSADCYVNANGDLIGFNMFTYCSNNPVSNVDPTGQSFWDVIKKLLGWGNDPERPSQFSDDLNKLPYTMNPYLDFRKSSLKIDGEDFHLIDSAEYSRQITEKRASAIIRKSQKVYYGMRCLDTIEDCAGSMIMSFQPGGNPLLSAISCVVRFEQTINHTDTFDVPVGTYFGIAGLYQNGNNYYLVYRRYSDYDSDYNCPWTLVGVSSDINLKSYVYPDVISYPGF